MPLIEELLKDKEEIMHGMKKNIFQSEFFLRTQ